jgi:hypothetical protein
MNSEVKNEGLEVVGYFYQHEETGLVQSVDAQQVEWGFEANNPRLHRVCGLANYDKALAAIAVRDKRIEDLTIHLADTDERIENSARNSSAFENAMGDLQVANGVLAARIAELEAKTRTAMGVGNGGGNLFVYGDYDSIKAAQKVVLERDQLRAELAAMREQVPVAVVDCGDDGFFADILPDRSVEVGQKLYAAPVAKPDHIEQPRAMVVPEGYALMPVALTAENGAKSALSGEFKIRHESTCSGCYYDEADPECEVCGGDITYTEIVAIDWTTIKEIYAKAVELLAAAPAQEGDSQ